VPPERAGNGRTGGGFGDGDGTQVAPGWAGGHEPGTNASTRKALLFKGLLAVWGPGLVVMLADTDAGSLITAGQSGARWGYCMVLPQVLLVPVLYFVQEMTVRLGIHTGEGHGALIRQRFGRKWAWLSTGTLFASGVGAVTTEFGAVAGVGQLFGVPRLLSVPLAAAFLAGTALSGRYRRVERVGVALGIMELVFIPAVVLARPSISALGHGLLQLPLGRGSYVRLMAADVGAVIMPWMIFYQQGAVIDKGLRARDIRSERRDTAVGAVLTQLIMVVTVIAFAATVGVHHAGAAFSTVGGMATVFSAFLGPVRSKAMVGAALLGAALVAGLVASLAGAWGLAEVFGWAHTLNDAPSRKTAKFYLAYATVPVIGATLVLFSVNLVTLVVDVMIMNALLLPVVLGFLLVLEARALPAEHRMHGTYRVTATVLCLAVMAFGLYLVPATFGWGLSG
jgi:Mn2+/Fe2+ NRAMP family transporter